MPNWKKVIVSGSDASLNSLNVTNGVTGSLFGTASWANNVISASYALNATSASFSATSSYVLANNIVGFLNQIATGSISASVGFGTGSFEVISGSNTILSLSGSGYLRVKDGLYIGDLPLNFAPARINISSFGTKTQFRNSVMTLSSTETGAGGIFPTQLVFAQETSSGAPAGWSFQSVNQGVAFIPLILQPNGSNVLIGTRVNAGFTLDVNGTSRFSNNMAVTGSVTATSFTGSLFGTASWAVSASQAITASFVRQALSASFALTAVSSSFSSTAVSASFASTAISASFATNAVSASYVLSSSYALFATSASYASASTSASYALTAASALNASDVLIYVKNSTGAQINKGTVVRISGSIGDNPLIATASYFDDNNSANTLGITNENIPHDSFGYVMTEGTLLGIDTSAFTAGQLLYLGATGSIIGTAPVAPLHAVRLGQVLRVQLNNGSMYVRIDNGYELGELHDVVDTTTTSSFGDLLVKSGSVWINSRQLTGSYGLTGSLNATSFTGSLLGTSSFADSASFATQANSAFTASSADNFTVRGTLTAQTIIAQTITSSTVYSSGSNIFGNSLANTQIFTGSVSITGSLNVAGTGITGSLLGTASRADNATSSSFASIAVSASFSSTAVSASFATNAVSASFAPTATNVFIQNGNSFGAAAVLGTNDVQDLQFETSGSTRMLISGSNGFVGIGTITPSQALDVNGTGRFTAVVETSTRTLKENIQPYATDIKKFKQLEPVSFTWKDTGKQDVGLVAEDVEKLFPEFVSKTDDGDVQGINYGKLATIFINVLKQQQQKIEALEKKIKKLTS